jgi:hypothetical protein
MSGQDTEHHTQDMCWDSEIELKECSCKDEKHKTKKKGNNSTAFRTYLSRNGMTKIITMSSTYHTHDTRIVTIGCKNLFWCLIAAS